LAGAFILNAAGGFDDFFCISCYQYGIFSGFLYSSEEKKKVGTFRAALKE